MTDAKPIVLDASALLAAIQQETGGDKVQGVIERSVISSVNWSEVLQKLQRAEVDTDSLTEALSALGLEVVSFTVEDAVLAAALWPISKAKGLSLADRSCLALGKRLGATVMTADKVWEGVDPDITIELIR